MAQLQGSNSSWDYTNDKLQNYAMKHVSKCGQKSKRKKLQNNKIQGVIIKKYFTP